MRTRPATRADIPALAALKLRGDATHEQWTALSKRPALEHELPEWERRFDAGHGSWIEVAVDDDDRPIAVCAFAQARERHGRGDPIPGRAHVNAVFVDPAHYRKGLARGLLERAEAAMRELGYREAQLWTLEGSPAELLYRALGWAPDGRREQYEPMDLPIVAYFRALP